MIDDSLFYDCNFMKIKLEIEFDCYEFMRFYFKYIQNTHVAYEQEHLRRNAVLAGAQQLALDL